MTVQFEGDGEVPIQPDKTLLELALAVDIPLVNVCGGKARCSTCRVVVVEGSENLTQREDLEAQLARSRGFPDSVRLACQASATGPVRVRRVIYDEIDGQILGQADSAAERHLAILFADIRNFTPFSERHLPYDIVHILNRYFLTVGTQILEQGGHIDKYMGDGVMALFGLGGTDGPETCNAALAAARAMLVHLSTFNDHLEQFFHERFEIGIGLHFGQVVVGELGHPDRKQLTAIGDPVNVTARIEAATKTAGVPLLVSEAFAEQVQGQDWPSHDLPLKGKRETARLYAPPLV